MALNTDSAIPLFFHTRQGIQSAIGLFNALVGFMVAGIIGEVSVLILVPIVNSIAVCLATGLNYYASFTAKHTPLNHAVADGFGSIFYLVQEAGLPFYNYMILKNILCGRERRLFRTLFWVLMLVILVIHVVLTVFSVGYTLGSPAYSIAVQKRLLLGYYLTIAIVEGISAVFLLKNFRALLRTMMSSPLRGGRLYRYIMRSTEIRLATMAFIGIGRTIPASLRSQTVSEGIAGDIDSFIYTVECLLPIIMYIDILSSRLIFAQESSNRGNNIPDIQEEGGSGQPQKESSVIINHCDLDNQAMS